MTTRRSRRRRDIAYHEAGHAVAAYDLRIALDYVTVVPTEDYAGCTGARFAVTEQNRWTLRDAVLRSRIENIAIACFAGDAAERRHNRRRRYGGAADFTLTFDYLLELTGSIREAEAYAKWLDIRAEQLVAQPPHWAAIKALANALLKQERIGGRAARRIIQEAFNDALSKYLRRVSRSSKANPA